MLFATIGASVNLNCCCTALLLTNDSEGILVAVISFGNCSISWLTAILALVKSL
jgi:hypothetical protein